MKNFVPAGCPVPDGNRSCG